MDTTQDTRPECRNCTKQLVRHYHESRKEFAKRSYCDSACRWEHHRSQRPPRPKCECGCGRLVEWGGRREGRSTWRQFAPGCYTGPRQNPRHAPWVDDGTGFWDWLAGFVDGEGYFGFAPRSFKRTYHTPILKIALRSDDRSILEEIAERTGCGLVRDKKAQEGQHPQVAWIVTSMSDALRMIEILDAHPLRAKKLRDYELWRKAVVEKDQQGNTPRIGVLVEELKEVRKWKGGDA